jgi:glycosyltransferase involved in cell wall biosynthesis
MYGMHPAVNCLPDRLTWHTPALHALRRTVHRDVRFLTTFHDLRHPYLFPKAGPIRAWVTRHLARASDVAIGTNGEDIATLRAWRANSALIPIGSNIPPASIRDARTVRARYAIPADAALLTTFGLLNQSKGIETVIDALALLRQDGMAASLLLIGAGVGANDPTNRATEAAIDAQCEGAGLTAFVRKTGRLPAADVAAALAASDVCVLPYRDGASPRRGSLLAALAQGIPVVTTTPAPGAYEGLPALWDGEVAWCVPPGDARAVADAVRAICRDDALVARLRAGAAAYAAQSAWPTIAARTLALYDTLGVTASEGAAVPVVASRVER